MTEAYSETNQSIQEKERRPKVAFINRYVLPLGEKLLLILAQELLRWLVHG